MCDILADIFSFYMKIQWMSSWTDERRPGINTFSSMETSIAIVMQNGERPGIDWIARIGEELRRRPSKNLINCIDN